MDQLIFPSNFLASVNNAPGFNAATFIETHQNNTAPTSIRVNPFKVSALKSDEQVPWCPQGYYLKSRPSFTFDPFFHAGCYYVQEASSMFIDYILRYIRPENESTIKVLDLCAAPGGKSTLISSTLKPDDLLVANELIKTRVPVLSDNLSKWGPPNIMVTNNDPKDFSRLKGFFDVILVDAPCSGSGMFRKDPAAMNEWSADHVNLCQHRQQRILANIYPSIKEDGYLIYSTCSYSQQENEDVLDWLCQEFALESIRLPIDKDWGIVESESTSQKAWGYRFYPDRLKGEGLFAAVLKKAEATSEPSFINYKNQPKPNYKEIDLLKPYIKDAGNYYYFKVNEDWLAINKSHKDSMSVLQQSLYIKKSGVRIGKLAGSELIPDHELALSIIINKDAVLQTELDMEQAIAYLRRDNIQQMMLDNKGWSLMNFEGHTLGWAKLLPNRINNYFPKELRILATHPKIEN